MTSLSRLMMIIFAVSGAACAHAQSPADAAASISSATGDLVYVRLFDAVTARPVANAALEVTSSNGIVCIKAPCPTDGRSWKGTSDANGQLVIPKSAINTTATIANASYHGDLAGDATPGANGVWSVDLFPEDTGDPGPHPLKLLDASTHAPIANVTLRIEARNSGGVPNIMSVTSNALGYIFVPFPFFTAGAETSWIVVPGYRDAHIDFAWARRKMYLEKR